MTRLQPQLRRLLPFLLLLGLALLVAACASPLGGTTPGASGSPSPTHSQAPLQPASPGANPIELLAWLFTPIFQSIFIVLVFFDQLTKVVVPGGLMVVAIFLLTLVIRLVTWPLTRRQLVSSRQTQLLQPELKAIQAKYKGDRVKSQAAVQEFYRQRGINPAGGCLPLLLQMPFLVAFYSMLGVAIELRHAPWLWIMDLSGPDARFDPIRILPILIIISMFWLQKMTPQGGMDPMQQKMMAFMMPVMLGVMSWSLAAGLSVYWLFSQLLSIIQQYWINNSDFGREMRDAMDKRNKKK